MKVSAFFRMIVKEFGKDIFLSVLLLALVDFLYANFTGVQLGRENGMILWQGGNDRYPLNLSTVLLKLLNLSIVFALVGKMADKISGNSMLYILVRMANYRKFIYGYSIAVAASGEMLLAVSHLVYYCFAGFYMEQAASGLFYFLIDALGFLGIMILYLILDNCCSLENSFVYVLAVYILNTVLPVPVLPAISTVRFLALKSRTGEAGLLLLMAGMDLGLAVCYDALIRGRRVKVC